MKGTIDDIISRRSIRKFTDEPVKKEDLDKIIECGLYAASGSGKQSTIMLVIQDEEILRRLERLNASVVGQDPDTRRNFYGAHMVIVVLGDASSSNCRYDGSLVMGNLMLAAHALGYGSCWINRARETFQSEEGKQLLKELGVEGNYEGVGNLIIGNIAGEYPEAAPRKDNRVFYF